MVQLSNLDHLEYREAILDSPEFREKLKKHEKYILDTNKNIKTLLKKFEDVITASETLKNAQDSFSVCLKDFQIGFVGGTNEEESDIVDTLESTFYLVQDIKESSTKMIETGNSLFKQLDNFRKEKINHFKEKKKEYERQTVKYCTTLDKYLASSQSSKNKDKNSTEDVDSHKEIDKDVREETNSFYRKCLEYVLCIQEFEDKWFHFFAESLFAFVQSWTTFYHEGYERHTEFEARFNKSQGGIQALRHNFEYLKAKSSDFILNILKDPDYFINSYETMSVSSTMSSDKNKQQASKQGYLYLLEKKTLGTSARVKQFCKYYKETKRLEVTPYNQLTNKNHQPEVYYVNNCQKSSSDKRFVFDVSVKDKGFTNVHTYQAMSYDDYKSWFAIMEGKELTPVSSQYTNKSDPTYILDKNGIDFIKKCTSLLEDDKLNEEGIYRKNGVSHKINQFIERNFSNISLSLADNHQQQSQQTTNGEVTSMTSALKTAHLSNSSSSSTLSLLNQINNNITSNQTTDSLTLNQLASLNSPTTLINSSLSSNNINRNNSNTNLNSNHSNSNNNIIESDDTCTITSALKHYLIHLKEPLMTYSFNQQFLNTCKIENISDKIVEIHKLLNALPAYNREAIEILMKHLFKVSTHSLQNKMTTSNLATCLGPTVFRTEQESVSNLYNIKFYSEIIELLILYHDKIFQPSLDASFLKNLTPLKTPPTMMSSALNNTPITTLIVNTPSLPPNIKTRTINNTNSNTNTNSLTNRCAIYEPNYRQTLINSSKTSVSSDSSQSDKEQHLNQQLISSPISTSSPSNQYTNNRVSLIQNSNCITNTNNTSNNNVSNHSSSGSPTNTTLINTSLQKTLNNNKPYKPFNSQTNQFYPINGSNSNVKTTSPINNTNANNTSNGNSNTNSSTSRSSTLSLNSNLSIQQNIYTKMNNNANSSPNMRPNNGQNTSSSNSLIMSPSPQLDNSVNNTKFKRARTLYPCEADNPSELSFEANVIISNVRRSKEAGWLEGTYNGKSGLVPGNYVQILED